MEDGACCCREGDRSFSESLGSSKMAAELVTGSELGVAGVGGFGVEKEGVPGMAMVGVCGRESDGVGGA